MGTRILVIALAVVAAVPGVGSAGVASPPEVIIQVRESGGFVPVEIVMGEVPQVTVLSDGRVFTEAPDEDFDRPRRFLVARIDDARIAELLQLAADLGLTQDPPPVYGDPLVTDLPSTTVTINVDAREWQVSAYALGFDDAASGLTPEQIAAREELQSFISEVASASPTRTYRPKRLAALASRALDDVGGGRQIEWPLGDLAKSGEKGGFADRCVIVRGDDLDEVLPLAKNARWNTRWQSGDDDWRIVFRPLLPNERTCADINAA